MSFDYFHTVEYIHQNYFHIFLGFGVLYLPIIFGIKELTLQKKLVLSLNVKNNIRQAWIIWNVALSMFSLTGTIIVAPAFIKFLTNVNVNVNVSASVQESCTWNSNNISLKEGWIGISVLSFFISKIIEFGDTIFICLLDKPLVFLHWYHHITTFVICYMTMLHYKPYDLHGVVANYFVHSLMYLYYATSHLRKSWIYKMSHLITVIQNVQMIYVVVTTCVHLVRCNQFDDVWKLSSYLSMYSVYFVLFLIMGIQRWQKKIN